jgi:HAD superfamily hydrolase (TIGR01509 family)
VIVDSERLANAVLARMVSALGRPMDAAEAARRFTGKVTRDCLFLIERELGLAVPAGFAADYEDAITAAYERELTPVDGIVPVLESLRGPRCIASGSSHPRIAHALRLVGLGHHFEGAVFSAEEVARGKPAPDVFLHAAARMGVDPDRCVVVEDSLTGVAGARASAWSAVSAPRSLLAPARCRSIRRPDCWRSRCSASGPGSTPRFRRAQFAALIAPCGSRSCRRTLRLCRVSR